MIKLFVDTDIILDLFAQREPHYKYSAQLFTLIDRGKVAGYTSAIVFANLHYLLKKMSSNQSALTNLRKLKTLIEILPIDDKIIEQSLNSDFNDFEDALQYFAAVNNGLKVLITRNNSDYKKARITISTAEEFMNTWGKIKK